MSFTTRLFYQTDLSRGVQRTPVRPALLTQDAQAHTFRIACVRGGTEESLADCTVRGYFIRADGVTVPLAGIVEDHMACVTLTGPCYTVPGRFQLVVKVSRDDTVATVFFGDGAMSPSQTDAQIDEEHIVPSLEELLGRIEEMERLAQQAGQVVGMTVEAVTLEPGSAATASYADGTLTLGIPKGSAGAPGVHTPYNYLDNSYFARPVNQRGQLLYTSTDTSIDRWLLTQSAHMTLRENQCIEIDNYIRQRIPAGVLSPSKAYTVAWMTADGAVHVDHAAVSFRSLENGLDYDEVYVNIAGEAISLVWAALYEGTYTAEALPPYVQKGYAAELLACQMYYHLYATESARPLIGMDCCPPMRLSAVTQGAITVDGETRYFNSAEL